MTTIEISSTDILHEGAVMDIIVMPSISFIKEKGFYKSNIPMFKAKALIDTGATSSCIDKTIADHLSLRCINKQVVKSPFTSHECNLYATIFQIPETSEYFSQIVPEADLSQDSYKVIIGRDVLRYCEFIYNGLSNSAKLLIKE